MPIFSCESPKCLYRSEVSSDELIGGDSCIEAHYNSDNSESFHIFKEVNVKGELVPERNLLLNENLYAELKIFISPGLYFDHLNGLRIEMKSTPNIFRIFWETKYEVEYTSDLEV